MNEFLLLPRSLQLRQTEADLLRCNETTRSYGLWLSRTDAARLAAQRFESLRDAGRVEFGGGVLPLLQSFITDKVGFAVSFIVPAACLAYLFVYALAFSKNVNTDIKVD